MQLNVNGTDITTEASLKVAAGSPVGMRIKNSEPDRQHVLSVDNDKSSSKALQIELLDSQGNLCDVRHFFFFFKPFFGLFGVALSVV